MKVAFSEKHLYLNLQKMLVFIELVTGLMSFNSTFVLNQYLCFHSHLIGFCWFCCGFHKIVAVCCLDPIL